MSKEWFDKFWAWARRGFAYPVVPRPMKTVDEMECSIMGAIIRKHTRDGQFTQAQRKAAALEIGQSLGNDEQAVEGVASTMLAMFDELQRLEDINGTPGSALGAALFGL